jgi:hypothetical protein
VSNIINGEGDIFAENKQLKRTKETLANSIDGVFDDIPKHVSGINKNL